MRTISRIILWIIVVVVVLTAGAYAYLRNADLSVYEHQIEGFLSETIGHKIDFDGLFELHFGNVTELTAEDVKLSNLEWTPDPVIASVGYFSIKVRLWSLISGPIVIEDLDVREVRIRLEKNEAAEANWATGRVREKSKTPRRAIADVIVFRQVSVDDVQFVYLNPARRRPINIDLEQLTIKPDENRILDLDMNATINEIPAWADGKLGPWENLVGGNDIIADLDMTLGDLRISLKGSVAKLSKLIGTELHASISGPAIDDITDRLGLPPFAEGEFSIEGRIVKLDAGNQIRLDGNLGDIDILASGTVDNLLELNQAQFDFNFSGPDTKHVAEVFGIHGAPAVPFTVTGDVSKADRRLTISSARVQLGDNALGLEGWLEFKDGIPDVDVTIDASGPNFSIVGPFVRVPGMPAEPFDVGGRIQKQGKSVRFDEVKAVVGANNILAHGAIGGEGSTDTEISFNATGPDISILGPITGLQGIRPRAFDISAVIKPDKAGIRIENARADFGAIEIGVDGVVGTGKGMTGTDLKLSAEGTDLREIALLAGVPMLPDGPFDVGVRAQLSDKELRLSQGTVSVAEMNGTVSGAVSLGSSAGDFDLDLSVGGPDLADALQFQWLNRLSGETFSVSGNLGHQAGEFELNTVEASISDFEIDIDGDFVIDDETGDITLRVTAPDAEELRKLIGVAYLPHGPVSLDGRIEKQKDELEFTDVTASLAANSIGIDGILSTSPLSNKSDLRFLVSGPDLREIGLIFDYDDLPAKSFSVSGEVNGIPAGFVVEQFVAKVGENDIDGKFTADLRGKPEVTGILSSSYIDLASRMQSSQEKSEATDEVTAEFMFSDEALKTQWMEAANVDIEIKTDRLILGFGDVRDFNIGIKLWDGILAIDPVSFQETDGSVVGNLRLAPANGAYRLDVHLNVENMHIGLLGAPDQDRSTLPPINGQFNFGGSGASVRELMASSNGQLDLTQGAGRLKDLITSRLFGDLVLQIMRTLNPLQTAEQYTTLECGIYRIMVEDGLATIQNFAIQTKRMTTVAAGNINLKNEKLNLTLRAAPREGLGISLGGVANSFLKLGGTLQSPKLQIDPTASVTTTGAAVATGGLSLLAKSLWDRARASADICEALEQEKTGQQN